MSEIINLEDFQGVKASIDLLGGDTEWKVELVDYINYETEDDSKEFFYCMLPFVRFINEPGKIAYTNRKKAICLNAPCELVEDIYDRWYFIFLHECLHQMWETFGAEDEVKKEYGSCNHAVMNIASDCIINEYLHTQKSFKLPFPTKGLITAKSIKDDYGVTYDPTKDTQVGLYLKLMEVIDKIKQNPPDWNDNPDNKPEIDHKSDAYVKGWNKAIEDWKSGKITKDNINDIYDEVAKKLSK